MMEKRNATKTKVVYRKPPFKKGNSKIVSEKDTEKNPLLKIDKSSFFKISAGNMFDDENIMINPGYENFTPDDKTSIDNDRFSQKSVFLVILRYFEYVITAQFPVSYILPLWKNGESTGDLSFQDIFDAVHHRLLMELQMRVPSFDEINMLEVKIIYKINYLK